MKIRKVNKYYCEFCKKTNCSRSSISKHEKRCTNNPNRECGMCKTLGNSQPKLEDLIFYLKNNIKENKSKFYYPKDEVDLFYGFDINLDEFRTKAGNCPACMLAAIRQAKIPVPATNFDFKKECESFWTEINDTKLEECNYGY